MPNVIDETYCLETLDLATCNVYCEEFPDHKGPHMAIVYFDSEGMRLRVSWEWE